MTNFLNATDQSLKIAADKFKSNNATTESHSNLVGMFQVKDIPQEKMLDENLSTFEFWETSPIK